MFILIKLVYVLIYKVIVKLVKVVIAEVGIFHILLKNS